MKSHLSAWIKRQVSLHWEHPIIARLARYAGTFLHAYENNCFDPDCNGEFALLKVFPTPNMIFDVGANTGEWARKAASFHPTAQIHAFEIVPETFKILEHNTAGLPNVSINSFGLLDASGSVEVHCYSDSSLATVHSYPGQASVPISALVLTGDEYCQRFGIIQIDFLKIDVEGAEIKVLNGFSSLLAARAIRLIQFEYALMNEIIALSLFKFYELLELYGYKIGKLHPNGICFLPYSEMVSNFRFGNFIAIQSDELTLLEAVQRFDP